MALLCMTLIRLIVMGLLCDLPQLELLRVDKSVLSLSGDLDLVSPTMFCNKILLKSPINQMW